MNQEMSPASKAGLIGTRFQVCGMEVGLCGVQGLRETMEDAFIITEMDDVSNHSLLAILDGHAGSGASTLVSRQFKKVLARTKHWQMYVNSLHGSMYRQEVCVTPASSEEGENKRYPTRSRSRSSGSGSSSSSSDSSSSSSSRNSSSSSNNSDSDSGTSRNSARRTRKNSDSRSASFCSEDEDTNGLVGGRKAWADTRLSKVSPASQTSSSTSTLRRGEDTVDIAPTSAQTQNLNLLRAALVEAYLEMDRALQQADNMDGSGSTAVVAVVTPTHILCANVGDSRCVLASDSRCVALSEDHKPTDEAERERIEKAGYFVAAGRVNGELAMSRALGDFQYKHDYRGVALSSSFPRSQVDSRHSQPLAHAPGSALSAGEQAVTCVPDVTIRERSAADQVLVLASDGVWDVLGNQDVVKFLSEYLPEQSPKRMAMTEAAVAVVELSLRQGSTDNISAIVARLSSWPSDSGAHYSGLQKGAGIAWGGRRKGSEGVRTNTGVPTVDDTDGDGDDIGHEEDEEEDDEEEGASLSAPAPPPPTPDACSGPGKGTKRKHR